MSRSACVRQSSRPVLAAVLLLVPPTLLAAEPAKRPRGKQQLPAEVVEVFAGIEQGQLEVRFIPRDAAKARLLITNKTNKPLSVRLPAAFAGVPVLAQFQDFQQNNAPQILGSGPNQGPFAPGQMNIPGQGQNMQNPFQGFQFNIPPEKVGKLKLATVCLEHGKPNPGPRVAYQIKPIGSVTQKAGVAELCAMLARGEVPQRAAQLAAWHLNNEIGWQELGKMRQKAAFGTRPRYSEKEISAAKKAAEKAVELAKPPGRQSATAAPVAP